jgi:hypothetical protein
LPVLRGFSRSVKQDSEASNASVGVSNANVSPWRSTVSGDSCAAVGSIAIHILCVKQK